jgi:hypothetical protein
LWFERSESRRRRGLIEADGIGARRHRAMLQIAEYVLRELLYRTVAARRIAVHGLEDDGVQIALPTV